MEVKRKIIVLISALILILIGIYLFVIVFVGSFLSTHNVHWTVQIDFYGAIIPTVISFFIISYLVLSREFPCKRYLQHFPLSVALALIFSTATAKAIVVYYVFVGVAIGFLSIFVASYDRTFSEFIKLHDLRGLVLERRTFGNALLIATSYAPLSVLAVDLLYTPFSTSTYIGAMGLTDGILLSALFAPLSVTFGNLFVMFLREVNKIESMKMKKDR